jgi:hypothetical protein
VVPKLLHSNTRAFYIYMHVCVSISFGKASRKLYDIFCSWWKGQENFESIGIHSLSDGLMSVFQHLTPEATPLQKCHMNTVRLPTAANTNLTTQNTVTTVHPSWQGIARFSRHVTLHLKEQFPERWTGRGGPRSRPLRSPDLTLLYFHERSYTKKVVCANVKRTGKLYHRILEEADVLREIKIILNYKYSQLRDRLESVVCHMPLLTGNDFRNNVVRY